MFAMRQRPGFWRKLREFVWPSIGVQRAWHYRMHRLARMKVSPHELAIGFAAGAFASFTPFIGLHFILAAVAALVVRGNLIASAVGTIVGNPLTFPLIWIASYNVGAAMLGISTKDEITIGTDETVGFFTDGPVVFFTMVWNSVEPVIWPMVLGGLPLGLACGFVCYWIVRSTLQKFRSRRADAEV